MTHQSAAALAPDGNDGGHTDHQGPEEHKGHDQHAGHSVEMFRDKFWWS